MKVLSNKLLLVSPVIALLAVFIFSLVLYPSATMKPANLPIAVVNLDEGVKIPDGTELKLGEQILGQISQATFAAGTNGNAAPVKWVTVGSEAEAIEGLNEQIYYGALVIPADFSAKQASLRSPEPQQAQVEVWVNQGMNATAAGVVTQMMNGMLAHMNNMISSQLVAELEAKGVTLMPSHAATIASPIAGKITNVNETGASPSRGNAPVSLFQPIWMASIAGAAISTLVISQLSTGASRREKGMARISQVVIGIILAVLSGFGMAWLAQHFLNLDVPSVADLGWFLALTVFAFFLMISAVLSWTGIKGIVLFVLLLFFGAPLLALPVEFMNGFYRDWVHSWLPMRFMVDGVRELFFFGQGFQWSGPAAILAAIAGGSFIVLLLSVFKPSKA